MAGTVRAAEAAPWVGFRASRAEQRLGVGTKETPLDPGPEQEGGWAGAPQAEASDPVRAGLMDSKPPHNYGVLTARGTELFPGGESLLRLGNLGPVPSPLWVSPLEYQEKGWTEASDFLSRPD